MSYKKTPTETAGVYQGSLAKQETENHIKELVELISGKQAGQNAKKLLEQIEHIGISFL